MKIRIAAAADARGIFQVWVTSWQTTYAGILPAKYLCSLESEDHVVEWQVELGSPDPSRYTYVAENENGEIIGYATGGPERVGDPVFKGELYAIYLLPENQRQGIGSQLIHAVASDMLKDGYSSIIVWALSANPAREFYEKLGGELVDQKEVEIGGANFMEVAYGWRDIRQLIEMVAATTTGV